MTLCGLKRFRALLLLVVTKHVYSLRGDRVQYRKRGRSRAITKRATTATANHGGAAAREAEGVLRERKEDEELSIRGGGDCGGEFEPEVKPSSKRRAASQTPTAGAPAYCRQVARQTLEAGARAISRRFASQMPAATAQEIRGGGEARARLEQEVAVSV